MILYNPGIKPVEFIYDGFHYIVAPKQSRNFPDYIAEHALERQHAPLVEYNQSYDGEMLSTDVEYSKMPWKKLVSLASARGVYKPGEKGLNRASLEVRMEEYDRTNGTVQVSSN